VDEPPEGTYIRRAHPSRGGRSWVREHPVHYPHRRRKAPPSPAPPRRGRAGLAAAGVAVAVTIGVLTFTGTFSGSATGGSNSLSVQVNVDLNQAVAVVSALGFGGTRSATYGTGCTDIATGRVSQFLAHHPCKEYASATLMAHRQGATAQVAVDWVVMPTAALAGQYKAIADKKGQGNPPGESLAFNGLCYASGQDGPTVWTEQVQPTGHLSVNDDREILQSAAPGKLPPGYLQQHCIG
jgi:hypothetical protein